MASPPEPPQGERPSDAGQREDRELLAAHLRGDREAFGALFAKHRLRLWALALRTTSSPEDAADALQDAMISAFRKADSYRGDAAVTTWLHRIVVNACLDKVRRNSTRAAAPLPEHETELPEQTMAAAPQISVDPADEIQRRDRSAQVHRALASLPTEQRAAIVLVDLEGYSVAEAAHLLEVAPGTIKSRCSRGRHSLAQWLIAAGNRNLPGAPHVPLESQHTDTYAPPLGRETPGRQTRKELQ